ncbi:hypothetical protein [Paenibacillus sp. Soil787]|uniref:hypothetical protein n=1 Tax=Paenibacillus sp. Soil787 TaxID=1736411 RepID=UPI0006F3AD11|nr:hypothetical protein [Paenibacillus sp. Soil787]KRF44020.1 hypothetical protein ASG93_03680 [Paenibacillus sp. Soil787]
MTYTMELPGNDSSQSSNWISPLWQEGWLKIFIQIDIKLTNNVSSIQNETRLPEQTAVSITLTAHSWLK